MDLRWFVDLANLARTGNFSHAAEQSSISQPAFSRRIKALEQWVGTELVDRSRHPVRLTDSGLQMLEAGQQAVSRLEAERYHIREALAAPDKYIVTFAVQHSIAWRFFPSWMQRFENAYQPIISHLRADDLPNCFDALEKRLADFVIAYNSRYAAGNEPGGSTESATIGFDALVPVSKPDANGKPLFHAGGKRQQRIPYLRFSANAPIEQHINPLVQQSGLHTRLDVVYENTMVGALRVRAKDGDGLAWLPLSLVQSDFAAGSLVLAGPKSLRIELEIRLHRMAAAANVLTDGIWEFLAARETEPLF